MQNNKLKIKRELHSTKGYIYLLVFLVLMFAIVSIGFLLWQTKRFAKMDDKAHYYNYTTILNCALVKEELRHVLNDYVHKQLPGYEPERESEKGPEYHLRTSLFLIKETLASIQELQHRYNDPGFASTLNNAAEHFNRIIAGQGNLARNSVVWIDRVAGMLPPLLVRMDQLQRLHTIAYKELQDRLAREKSQGARNLILLFFGLGLIGFFLVVKILDLIKKSEIALMQAHYDRGERIKEQSCLYEISKLVHKENIAQEEILQGVADLIPPAMQYPEITCVRIRLDEQSYETDGFREAEWLLDHGITVYGKKVGTVEIYYLEKKPEFAEGPFLKEERGLLNSITARLGHTIERIQVEHEKVKLEDHLRQAHKMEAIGTMAGGIAHDFNNILTIIIGNADLAFDDIPKDHPVKENLEVILKASHRASELVKQILAFSRRDMSCQKPFYLCRLVDETMKVLRATIPTTVELHINIPAKCRDNITQCYMVLVDPSQIHQLLMNLCVSAVQAMDEKGVLKVIVDVKTINEETTVNRPGLEPGTYEYLSVSDTGAGMTPEIIEQIYDPFFTTKDVGKGTGMGLSVVHGIMEGHNGKIFVDSASGEGTTFHLYFPVVETAPEQQHQDLEALPTAGTERVLFVDDEEMLVKMWSSTLTRQGYKVTTCGDGTEALEAFLTAPDNFDLVITDQTMPNMSGAELAVELLKIRPDIPIILCTGYSSKISVEEATTIGVREFCMKPLDKIQLAKTIRKVLDVTDSIVLSQH